MPTTVYDVSTRYALNVSGQPQLGALGRTADSTWSSIKRLGAMMAGGAAFGLGKKYLIDANAEMENLNLSMARSVAMNLHVPFDQAQGAAARLVSEMREIAKASPGTTRDFANLGEMLVGPWLRAGGALKGILDVTRGIMLAKPADMPAEVAARDIESALAGTLSARDRFARSIIEPRGFNTERFNALSGDERRKQLLAALNDPAILASAKAVETSWAGVTSTLEENIENALRKVGLPLFQELSKEIQSWNTWLDANGKTVEAWTTRAGTALREGFGAAKDAVLWIVDNKDTLITIAELWVGGKVAGGIYSAGAAAVNMVSGVIAFGTAAGETAIAVAALAGPIGIIIGVLGVAAAAYGAFTFDPGGKLAPVEMTMEDYRKRREAREQYAETMKSIHDPEWFRDPDKLRERGPATRGGSPSVQALFDLPPESAKKDPVTALMEMLAKNTKDTRPQTNIHIHKVEVASDHPDRFVHALSTMARRAARNPTAARSAISGRL